MRLHWQRGLVAMALGLVAGAGLARGKEPAVASTPQEVPAEEIGMAEPPILDEEPGHRRWRLLPHAKTGQLRDWWQNHPLYLTCYGHHNDYACGSIRSDLVFLFGSCRFFYGERCLRTPPASPVPGFDPATLTYDPHAPILDRPCRCR